MNAPNEVLALSFYCGDLERHITVREYLIELLFRLWDEGESFSGKRPFGNSGWEWDLYVPLIKARLITGDLDEYDCINECDEKAGHKLIRVAIAALAQAQTNEGVSK